MGYTAPTTRASGYLVTATNWNTDLVDNITYLANPPHCALRHSANQNHSTTTTWQAIAFDTEDEDTASLHSAVNNTRITVTDAGLYLLTAGLYFVGNATGNARAVAFRKNGTGTAAPNIKGRSQLPAQSTSDLILTASTVVKLAANDYVETVAFQNSGGALVMQASATEHYPYFTATWMGLG